MYIYAVLETPLSVMPAPLALGRFLRRAAAGACKNRSATPLTAPCFCHWQRSLFVPPRGGAKSTRVGVGGVSGKAKPQKSSPYHKVSLYLRAYTWLSLRESWREAPERGALQARPQDAPACICPSWPGPSGATKQNKKAPVPGRSGVCVVFQK